jgi:acid phosphatase family membrane protein YuiD
MSRRVACPYPAGWHALTQPGGMPSSGAAGVGMLNVDFRFAT